MAYIIVAFFSNHGHCGYEQLSAAVSQLFRRVQDIDPRRIFINYENIAAWSVADRTFSDGWAGAE